MIKFLRIVFYAAVLALVLVFAVFLHSSNLFVAFCALLLIPIAAEVLFVLGSGRTTVHIHSRGNVLGRNDGIHIYFSIRNKLAIGEANIAYSIKNMYYDEYKGSKSIAFYPIVSSRFALPLRFENLGIYTISIKSVTISDLFGIFKKNIYCNEKLNIYVMPQILDNVNISSGNTEIDIENALNNYASHSGDLSGIREYIPGDRLNSVHWKSTAKRNEIMVKEYEKHGSREYILLFDFNKKYIDNGFDILYSLMYKVIERGCGAYVMWLTSGCEDLSVKYIGSKTDADRLIRMLYRSYPIYTEGATVNAFKRVYGTSNAVYIRENVSVL